MFKKNSEKIHTWNQNVITLSYAQETRLRRNWCLNMEGLGCFSMYINRVLMLKWIRSAHFQSFLPESLRWLLTTRKIKKARALISTIARVNKVEVPDIDEIKVLQGNNITSREAFIQLVTSRHVCFNLSIALIIWWVNVAPKTSQINILIFIIILSIFCFYFFPLATL